MKENERDCILVLDEMAISAAVEFDVQNGGMLGNVTPPDHDGVATHALVFMVSGTI